jgi:two-component system, NtrC family, nitrogen regulation response regulator GlnG
MPLHAMICDDEESLAWALRKLCEKQGYHTTVVATGEAALLHARSNPLDVVFLDVQLPGSDGLTVLGQLRTIAPDAAVVIITAHGNLNTAVQAVSGGAFDYLSKPFDLDQAVEVLTRSRAKSNPKPEHPHSTRFQDELIGRSPAMQHVFKRIALAAPSNSAVMLTGESGTGKELVARALHNNSPRRNRPFLPIHIAAMNPNLVESELFGHVKGAFSGAERNRTGLLVIADGGTVFLDELADIPLAVQAKLLRVLERQEVLPVGTAEAVRIDVRVISATHANLAEAVQKQTFRHDLFYRLNVFPIHLPALRDRPGDVPILAKHFAQVLTQREVDISPETLETLQTRKWLGNVRELKNAIEHAIVVSRGEAIRPEHLPKEQRLDEGSGADAFIEQAVRRWISTLVIKGEEPTDLHQRLLDVIEPVLLADVLGRVQGNRLVSARWLGLARATVRKLMRKYHLGPATETEEED